MPSDGEDYRVIQIKLRHLVYEKVHMITDLPTNRI